MDVWFYHLLARPLESALPALVARTLANGWTAVIQATSPERLAALEEGFELRRLDALARQRRVRRAQQGDVLGQMAAAVPVEQAGKAHIQLAALAGVQRDVVAQIPRQQPVELRIGEAQPAAGEQERAAGDQDQAAERASGHAA